MNYISIFKTVALNGIFKYLQIIRSKRKKEFFNFTVVENRLSFQMHKLNKT